VNRAVWEASLPKCPKGQGAGLPICGEPLHWDRWEVLGPGDVGQWVCPAHGPMLTGVEAARRAGFVAMWFSGQAA
jgi:hypothetical protein